MKQDVMIYGAIYFVLCIPLLWNLYKGTVTKKMVESAGFTRGKRKDENSGYGFEIGLYVFLLIASYFLLSVWRIFSDAEWDFERHLLNANLMTILVFLLFATLSTIIFEEPARRKNVLVKKWVSESLKVYMEETRNTNLIGWKEINERDVWLEYGSPEFQLFLNVTKDAEKWVKTKRIVNELHEMRHNQVENQMLAREADEKLQQLGMNIRKELETLLPVLSGIEERQEELKAYLETFVNETDKQGKREAIEITELKAILKRNDMPDSIRQSAQETLDKIHEKQQEPNAIIDPFMEAQAIIRAARMKHYLE